ncbi:unnamed protein product [Closterium sp. NIES-64]|nr:unnamed protein product [Closterium sp. NIES-64]
MWRHAMRQGGLVPFSRAGHPFPPRVHPSPCASLHLSSRPFPHAHRRMTNPTRPILPCAVTPPPKATRRARGHCYYNSGVGVQLSPPPHPPADFPSSHVSLPLHPLPPLLQSLSHVALGPSPAAARLWPSLSQRCSCAAITTAPPTSFPPMSPCPCTLSHPSCNHSHTSRMAPPPRQLGKREAIAITTVATGSEKSGPCTGTDKDESEEGESEEGESEEGESEEGEPAGGQRASDPTLPPAAASPRFPKRASARVVSAPAPTARKRLRADGTGDVRGVEGAGAEIGVGEGGRAASGAASGAENKGAGADEVGTAGGGQRANDARTAQAGGAEKRTVRDAKDVGKVERLRLAGIFQLESGEWVAQATIRGQQWYLGWQRSRANVLYLLCMARTVFGEPADLGLDLHTITRAAWEAEWKQARHIPPGLWAVMHGHMLTRTVHRYRMVLSSFNASAGDGESDEESRVLALCAAIGATAATVEKCGAATELYATALTASCAAVWSIWRGDSTASAVERAVAVARAVGAALPRLRLCRLAIGAVLATLGNESRVSGGAASSDPDGHVARVMEQALGGAGLARNKPAKVVVKKMVDTLGLWSACAAAADPLVNRGFHMPLTASMKRKLEARG